MASGIWLAACNAGPPHQHQPDPQARSPEHTDRLLPPTTYWTGLLFKGAKIGFSRFAIAPRDNGGYEIRTETTMRFRFLTVDKSIAVRAVDLVAPDLALRRFHYRYELDGSRLELRGTVREGQLEVEITNAGVASHQSHPLRDKLYPTSVATLYPMVHGIEPGREFAYSVYDGETRSISQLRQTIVGFEFGDRFDGSALRLETWLHGQRTTTWLDTGDTPRAGPVLETTLGGALVARREEPDTARAYLASAAVDAREDLSDFSNVRTHGGVPSPRRTATLVARFSGFGDFAVPSDERQQCHAVAEQVHCTIDASAAPALPPGGDPGRYLEATLSVPSADPRIRALAVEITRDRASDESRVEALLAWIQTHVEQQAVDVFSALDVLNTRKAECQGNSYLYAAFARSLGIPTRVVNGLVYSEPHAGFLYHTWSESLIRNRWRAIDPTFGQLTADATHIKLVEGESLADLTPILAIMGRLEANIDSAQ